MRIVVLPPIPRPRKWRLFAWLSSGLLLAGWAAPAYADVPALHDLFLVFEDINTQVINAINAALGNSQIEHFVYVLFAAMAMGLFVWKFAGFALRGFHIFDMLEMVFTIMFVYALLHNYKTLIPAIYEAGRYAADTLGQGIAGADAKPGQTMAESIFEMLLQLQLNVACDGIFDCLGKGIVALPAVVIGYILIILLGVVATLIQLWVMWGFQIIYAVGWVMVPFLLYERLSFLFDGWLKFFLGMVIYNIIAMINLGLVLATLGVLFHNNGTTLDIHGFFDFVGLVVFLIVCLLGALSGGKFASAIVGGAGAGGVSGMVKAAASTAAAASTGGAGAAAKAAGAAAGAAGK